MECLKIECFVTAVAFLSSGAIHAQQVISLENDLGKAHKQVEQVRKELLNSADIFVSKGSGSLKHLIEKSKEQGCLYITNLTIKGDINFSDLHFIATLPRIEKLDLYEANIVGEAHRSHNVYPSDVYEGLKVSLKEIILPRNLLAIDRMAFKDLSSLKKVVVPATCRIIGEKAFSNTTSLFSISLPEGLVIIEDGAFSGSGLEILSLPPNIKSVGRGSFQGSMLRYFSSEKVEDCFFISDQLLADCPNLEYVAFHKKVRILGKQILFNTPSLKNVKLDSPLPPYLLDRSLRHLNRDVKLQIPEPSLHFYRKKSGWRRFKKNYITGKETNHVDVDTRYKERLAALADQNFVTHIEIAKPNITSEVQEVDVIDEQGLDLFKREVPESNSSREQKESLPFVANSRDSIVTSVSKLGVMKLEQKSDTVNRSKLEQSIESAKSDSQFIKKPVSGISYENKIEEIEIDEILVPDSAKVYWLSGKLYIEASKTIKVANLMTLDGMYVYGKAESEKIWSFKIDAARVASIRVGYVDANIPEIIKIH